MPNPKDLEKPEKLQQVRELLLISTCSDDIISRILAKIGFGKRYYVLNKYSVTITDHAIHYPMALFLKMGKNIFAESAAGEMLLRNINFEFLAHDTLGRLSAYSATISRLIPQHVAMIDKLHEETKAEQQKQKDRLERYG